MYTLGNPEKRRYDPAMSITPTVQNDTIRLPKGTHFPDGTQLLEAPGRDQALRTPPVAKVTMLPIC